MGYQSIFKPGLFAGQTVVITGGGSGIGRCTAHELAALGAEVAIVGRSADKLNAVQAEIRDDGGRVSMHSADIRDEAAVSGVIDAILNEHGRIDGLFNNAGGQYRAPLETITTKGFEAVVRNNLTGGFIVMREVYTKWMRAHGGAIVNMIADIWHGWPHFAHSAAARGGMLTLSESAATEWAAAGVRINTIPAPSHRAGWTHTRAKTPTLFATRSPIRFHCSASEPRQKPPRRWSSCCHRPPASSPGHASASTVERPTPSQGGGNCKRWSTTSRSTASIAPPCPQSLTLTNRTSCLERAAMTAKVLYDKRGEVAYITLNRPEVKRHRHRIPRASVRYLARLP